MEEGLRREKRGKERRERIKKREGGKGISRGGRGGGGGGTDSRGYFEKLFVYAKFVFISLLLLDPQR